jgi:hypothetical protein
LAQTRLNRGDHAHRELVLKREDVVERAVVTLRPDVPAGLRLDQLTGDAQAVRRLADTALEDVAHAELTPGLLQVHRSALVGEARIAGDHEEPLDAREAGDDVLGHAVGEILLLHVAAHVGERQHGDRRPVGQRERGMLRGVLPDALGLDARLDAIDMDRAGDVLHAMLAEVGEADRKLLADMLAHGRADADLAGLGERLEPRRDVDAIAKNVIVLDDHVANVDADAKADALAFIDVGIAVFHALLHHDGAAHRIDDRRELDENAVTRGLDDTALVLGDQRIDELPAMALERGERPFLVGAHEARVSRHVRGKDGGEPARDARLLAHSLSPSAWSDTLTGLPVYRDCALVGRPRQRCPGASGKASRKSTAHELADKSINYGRAAILTG